MGRARGASDRASFDHLVGAGEDRWRDGDAELLGSLEIDDQLEGRRLLDRQVGRLGTLEDPSGVKALLAIDSLDARSIADQAAGSDVFAPRVDRRDGVA